MPQKPFRATTSFCRIPFSSSAVPTNQRAHRQQFCTVGSEGVQQQVGRDPLALVEGALVTDGWSDTTDKCEWSKKVPAGKLSRERGHFRKSKRRWEDNIKTDLK